MLGRRLHACERGAACGARVWWHGRGRGLLLLLLLLLWVGGLLLLHLQPVLQWLQWQLLPWRQWLL